MDETVIVIMLKDKQTGFLEKEICSAVIKQNENLLVNAYAANEENIIIHLKLSTDRSVDDWEFDAVYDNYDTSVFGDLVINVSEVTDSYEPTWEITFQYEDEAALEQKIHTLLSIHRNELNDVYDVIKEISNDMKEELN